MKSIDRVTAMLIVGNVLCAVIPWYYVADLIGMEFGGGSVTGSILDLSIAGSALFLLCALALPWRKRAAMAASVAAALACFPLYLYFLLPGLFQAIVPGNYSVVAPSFVSFNGWAVAGVLSLLVMIYLDLRRPSA